MYYFRMVPWAVCSMFLRNLVPDAAPSGGTNIGKVNNNLQPSDKYEFKQFDRKTETNIKQENGIREKVL